MNTPKTRSTDQTKAFPLGRAFAAEQALASARIEGFKPTAAFTADFAEVAAGRMQGDEFRARLAQRLA